jgi:hypothetical protein
MTQLEQKTHFIFKSELVQCHAMRKKRPTQNSPVGVLFHHRHQSLHRRRSVGDHADACCGIFGVATKAAPMMMVWEMRTHLVACFVCCRCAPCRRLIRTGDTGACRDPRPHNESALAIPTGERLEGDLLSAALSKKAALISCLPLAAAALLMTGTFGLAFAAGGRGTGQAAAVERNGLFGKSIGLSQAARSRAAGKFRAAASSMLC